MKDISFNVKKGEFICVIGDVGSGKSSLLNAINGDMIYVCPDNKTYNEIPSIFDEST